MHVHHCVYISVTLAGEDQPPTLTAGDAIKCYGKATKMTPSEKVRSPSFVVTFIMSLCTGDLQASYM